ncbi:hypothetical protein EKE94_10670 [Mesobaculum littorinae]|uniref:Uncharacterized protein n=1 Tax=Mesobaculum littorinae TaxID=2486419 RepID=A0A438AH31_9RHOB|nr:hypothetical protein [Mesobaculum littorinae]RVV97925.1 hypothetical protein EKE94_10670 [Mesobaculum littorinae]
MPNFKEPPRSALKPQSGKIFAFELAARIFVLLSIFLAAAYFIIQPEELFGISSEDRQAYNLGVLALTLLLTFIADNIASSISGWVSRNSMTESHDQIMAAIEGRSDVTAFGSQAAFERHIENRISLAIEVRNTFVSFRTASGNPNAKDQAALKCYKAFFEAEAAGTTRTWIDIVSYNEVFGPRFLELNKSDFMKPKASARHVLRVIRHNIPTLNFTLIYYDSFSQRSEVVFGWMHSDVTTHHKLFRSVDPNIIEMFERLFNLLSQYKIQPDFNIEYGHENYLRLSNMSDRSGWWYCIGVISGDSEGSKHPAKMISESLFRISFKENGAEIEGRAQWLRKYGNQEPAIEHFSHKADKVSYTEQKMFLEYRSLDSSRKGICVYNFKTKSERGAIDGYLQDSGAERRVQLLGIRLDQSRTYSEDIDEVWEAARRQARSSHISEYLMHNHGEGDPSSSEN